MISYTSCLVSGSSPVVGSSKIRYFLPVAKALKILKIVNCPPDKCDASKLPCYWHLLRIFCNKDFNSFGIELIKSFNGI